ncbi:uncharacterized protein LOC120209597 [Hibiscus syriacus]|uniref:uncharacterized protein LOC120209597 n=1 Tax=Hibiscus syriacus TaxID=106335 RepID=UPI0019238DD8|nr:uncharacterized protein LOC120209597 [Hibiscus syriacus]
MLKVKNIWDEIRVVSDRIDWQRLVWFPGHVPKHNTISWIAILGKLPTKDLLMRMGMRVESRDCLLCDIAGESRDHMFFDCPYSKRCWASVLGLCSLIKGIGGWNEELN